MNSVTDRRSDANSGAQRNGTQSAGVQVRATAFKEYTKNTLQGFCDLELPAIGLKIIGATLHEKNGERWIGLPARPYQEGGEQKWAAILDFVDKNAKSAFQKAALAAVDEFRAAEGQGW